MFIVNSSRKLEWKVKVWGSKNAVLPIIAASLLIKWKVVLKNVPKIGDVYTFLDILSWVGLKYCFDNNVLTMDTTDIKEANFDLDKIKKIRVSVLLLSPLLSRLWKVTIPTPWGCNLWKRSISSHLEWLKTIWYDYKMRNEEIILKWALKKGDLEVNAWFWVTPTENLIVANVLREGTTYIKSSAIEPHVMNLVDFLREAWASISIRYDNTIIINWVKDLKEEIKFKVISDYLQSWTYMIIAALASKSHLVIENARKDDLFAFIQKLNEAWVKIEDLWNDTLKVYRTNKLNPVDIQTNIFPWFPTDLQSPFAILMTKAEWTSRIHEILFEGRLNWLVELDKMWWHTAILNPHEAMIFWKELVWASVTSWDLRAWAAMLIAWLIAEGETKISNIDYIKRWYEGILDNLVELWADIKEVKPCLKHN